MMAIVSGGLNTLGSTLPELGPPRPSDQIGMTRMT
jgi:hypothetical protein